MLKKPHTFPQPICEQIWDMKYKLDTPNPDVPNDLTVEDTWSRVARSIAGNSNEKHVRYYNALDDFKFLTAGRITAGAGSARTVTLFNCFVMGVIPDTLPGIFDMLKEAALTMQQGGGIGYDFSPLRPQNSPVAGVDADASGPLTFMDVWDTMCKTIMSAGSRRGAMMATMACDHPDILNFIEAKQDSARLRNFNISILATDRFMEAVKNDTEMPLVHSHPPKDKSLGQDEGGKWIYGYVNARDLWEKALRATYDYAEPGVLFIDRINKYNNLWFVEEITATNPCGEQPLPPYGACLLGSINLVKFVTNPFSPGSLMDTEKLAETVRTAVRMLDGVIDISGFPLEAQKDEALHKRRMGLGVTGLADMLFMMGFRYGTEEAAVFTEKVMKLIAVSAYGESIQMAKEMGPCPALKTKEARELFVQSGFMQNMPKMVIDGVLQYGLRNTHLTSIAPTGTISMYAGNVSSGGEPIFAPEYERKVTREDGTKETEIVRSYSVHEWHSEEKRDHSWWENYMVTAQELTPVEHIRMQAAAQKWVDSSISKTINCPEDISFEDFEAVYMMAYDTGCKGCTTYRPNDVTGSVLSVPTDKPAPEKEPEPTAPIVEVMDRPEVLNGNTYKLRWEGEAVYVTFTHQLDEVAKCAIPFEIFVNSKNPEHQAWVTALTRMISAVFRRGGDVSFVAEELKNVFDPKGGQFVKGKYVPSLVALLGLTLEKHMQQIGYLPTPETLEIIERPKETTEPVEEPLVLTDEFRFTKAPNQCPSCKGFNVVNVSGCPTCQDCGHSKCG